MLTQQHLREILDYNPETGEFRWRKGKRIGQATGTRSVQGYKLVTIKNEKFRTARLAWLYMTGEWPPEHIDHINGKPGDDRWVNLRAATRAENMQNMKRHVDNSSGYRGVSWSKRQSAWHARVTARGKNYHCGYFATREEAKAARDVRAAQLHGAFARFEQLKPHEAN